MATAQELLKVLLIERVAPWMKQAGFARSSSTWQRTRPEVWQVMTAQRSTSSTRDEAKFTFNLSVYSHTVARLCGESAAENGPMSEPTCHFRERIGFLLPERNDKWWTISAGDAYPVGLGAELDRIAQNVVVPYFESFQTNEALLRARVFQTPKHQAALLLAVQGWPAFESYMNKFVGDQVDEQDRRYWTATAERIRTHARAAGL